MKRKLFVTIFICWCFLLVACGSAGNSEQQETVEEVEETSLLLTDEMKSSIEERFEPDDDGIYWENLRLISYIYNQNSILKATKSINLSLQEVEVTSWEQRDDYSYFVYGKAYNTDEYNDRKIYKFSAIYTCTEDTTEECGYSIDIEIDSYKEQ